MRSKSKKWKWLKELERLFTRARNKLFSQDKRAIEVNYVRRFRAGECVLAATIPLGRQELGLITCVALAHQHYHYKPTILHGGRKGTCLRLMYRFKDVKSHEEARMLLNARMIANWAENLFGLPAYVSPINGLIAARWKLRAFE